jgi:hypothetical protein
MPAPSGDLAALIVKLALGTLAFVWILWTVRNVDRRAVGMMLTFPALNGVVLLTATDQHVGGIVAGIIPLMFFNGMLAAIFIALRRQLGDRQWAAFAICLAMWAALAAALEWPVVWPYRWSLAVAAGMLIMASAGLAFRSLRRSGAGGPAPVEGGEAFAGFLRDRAPRVFWFLVSFLIVSLAAHRWTDAHSLVGRLSALPLVPLFVLHWAVNARRVDLDELRLSAMVGPVAAMGFVFLFAFSLGFIRGGPAALHPWYWPIGIVLLLAEWELARRAVNAMARLSYRTAAAPR